MESLALKDKDLFPTPELLNTVLAGSYPAYQELGEKLAASDINPDWRYYNDGKAWMCKLMFKKKNLGWLHVYNGHFNVTFYFMERHLQAIADLPIAETVKKEFFETKATGKLLPMTFIVTDRNNLGDVLTALEFKKSLK